jgi:hypothetical protein
MKSRLWGLRHPAPHTRGLRPTFRFPSRRQTHAHPNIYLNLPVALAVGTGTRRLLRAARRRCGEQGGADFPTFRAFREIRGCLCFCVIFVTMQH